MLLYMCNKYFYELQMHLFHMNQEELHYNGTQYSPIRICHTEYKHYYLM